MNLKMAMAIGVCVAACARGEVSAADYTSASYIQDGLINQWDGIDNAGTGTHDGTSMVWKDLKGGLDLTLIPYNGSTGGRWSAAGNSLVVAQGSATNAQGTAAYRTIEIVFKNTSSNSGQFIFFSGNTEYWKNPGNTQNSGWRRRVVIIEAGSDSSHMGVNFDGGKHPDNQIIDLARDTSAIQCVAATYGPTNETVNALFNDGEQVLSPRKYTTNWGAAFEGVTIGQRQYTGNAYPWPSGEVYTIRLYNRVLTPTELYLNHMIDDVRFRGTEPNPNVRFDETSGTWQFKVAAAGGEHGTTTIDGAPDGWATAGSVVTISQTPAEGRAFSHWDCGDAERDAIVEGDVCTGTIKVSMALPHGDGFSAVYGLQNKDDPTDLRAHGYRVKTIGTSTIWTDDPTCWEAGYVPTGLHDVIHFAPKTQGTYIKWSTAVRDYGTVADAPADEGFYVQSGWGTPYTFKSLIGSTNWWINSSQPGGIGTRPDSDRPLVIPLLSTLHMGDLNPAAAEDEIVVEKASGEGFLRKTGAGTLTIKSRRRGGVRLEAGTLRIGQDPLPDAKVAPGAFARFDAAAANTMTWTNGRLTQIADADGGPVVATATGTNGDLVWPGPTLSETTVNGVNLLDFGGYCAGAVGDSALLNLSKSLTKNCLAAFMVFDRPAKEGSVSPVAAGSNGVIVPASGEGFAGNSPTHRPFEQIYENGAPYRPMDNSNLWELRDGHDMAVVTSAFLDPAHYHTAESIAGSADSKAAGGIRLAEVVVYNKALTQDEIEETNLALQRKWHDRTVNDLYPWSLDVLTLLGPGTAVEVPEGKLASVREVHQPEWDALGLTNLVKTGTGVLEIDRSSPNLDADVRGGTLRFIRESAKIADSPQPAPHAVFWGDALKTDSFIFGDGNAILVWKDCRAGVTETMTNYYGAAPTLNMDGLHGLPCVDFGDYMEGGARLGLGSLTYNTSGVATPYTTTMVDLFIVWRNTTADVSKVPSIFNEACGASTFARSSNGDLDTRTASSAEYRPFAAKWTVNGRFMNPEREFADRGRDEYVVIRCRAGTKIYASALGGRGNGKNGGGFQVAEYIAYDYPLSDFQARQTEAYLMKKWLKTDHPDEGADVVRSLSVATDAACEFASPRTVGSYSNAGDLAFGLPRAGTATPLLTLTDAFTLPAKLTLNLKDGKLSGGDYPLVSAASIAGDPSLVAIESNAKNGNFSLFVRDGTLYLRSSPNGCVILFR